MADEEAAQATTPVEPHVPREIMALVREIRMALAPGLEIDQHEAILYTRMVLQRVLDTWMPLPDGVDGEIEEDEEPAC